MEGKQPEEKKYGDVKGAQNNVIRKRKATQMSFASEQQLWLSEIPHNFNMLFC